MRYCFMVVYLLPQSPLFKVRSCSIQAHVFCIVITRACFGVSTRNLGPAYPRSSPTRRRCAALALPRLGTPRFYLTLRPNYPILVFLAALRFSRRTCSYHALPHPPTYVPNHGSSHVQPQPTTPSSCHAYISHPPPSHGARSHMEHRTAELEE